MAEDNNSDNKTGDSGGDDGGSGAKPAENTGPAAKPENAMLRRKRLSASNAHRLRAAHGGGGRRRST